MLAMTYPPGPPEPPPLEPTPGKAKRSVSAGQVIGAILLILVVVFIFENTRKVRVRLIIPEVHAPLFVALLIAAVLGALGAALVQYRRHRKQ
jgi:uncharacterized integral membrane protein